MIELICGEKGSGKTKRIIDMANDNIASAAGTIVFLSDTDRYMYDIRYQIRVFNALKHKILTEETLIGFIKGITASDHDIESFYIDGAHRILKKDVSEMKSFFDELKDIADHCETKFIVAVSKDINQLPEFLAEYEK